MQEQGNELVIAALWYCSKGWRVLPLHSISNGLCSCGNQHCSHPGKHPRIKDWVNAATTDEEQIKKWWGVWPEANIGILTGEQSGIVVLDIDGSEGLAIVKKLNLPETIRVKSGKDDGWHYYFKAPVIPIKSRIKALPEIDVKGAGGYIVAPPSLHVSGNRYTSESMTKLEPAPLPASVIEMLQLRGGTTNDASGSVGKTISSSQRNVTLTSWAGKMRRIGLNDKEIYAALLEKNRLCDPPLEHQEVETIARSIVKKPSGVGVLEVQSLEDLLASEVEPVSWLVEPLLTEGLGILVGAPKIGKSQIALNLAISVATGKPFLGKFSVQQGRVLLLFLEDGKGRVRARTEMIMSELSAEGVDGPPRTRPRLDLVDWGSKINKSTEGGLEMLDGWLLAHSDARLVVIDTLTRFRAMQRSYGNAYENDVLFMEPLQALAMKHRVCILLVHHDKKGMGEDPLDKVSGSKGLPGTADQCWLLNRDHRGNKQAILECFGRDFEEIEIGLSVNKKMVWRYEGTATERRLSDEERNVIVVLSKSDCPLRSSLIAKEMGLKLPKVSKLLKRMLNKGLISSRRYGEYEIYKEVEN